MKSARATLAAIVLLFLLPSNSAAIFNGLPLASKWEVLAASVFLGFLTSKLLRQQMLSRLAEFSERTRRGILTALVCLAVAKCVIYLFFPTSGQFEVCYRDLEAKTSDACTVTFEPHPALATVSEYFSRRSTEVPVINFGPRTSENSGLSRSTWRLPFVNSLQFDQAFWPWEPSANRIETFPFRSEYRARLDLKDGDQIRVEYLGEGRITVGRDTFELPSSYERTVKLVTPPSSGNLPLVLDFRYTRTVSNSNTEIPPYAMLRVERVRGEETTLLHGASSRWLTIANLLSDLVTSLSLVGVVWLTRAVARKMLIAVGLAGFCTLLTVVGVQVGIGGVSLEGSLIVLACAMLFLVGSKERLLLLAPSFVAVGYGLTVSEIRSMQGFSPQLGDILVRLRGNDHLVYYGLSRLMLDSGFLRGAEDVYYFQPGIRYVFYLMQLIVGESGVLVGALSMCLLGLGINFFMSGLPKPSSKVVTVAQGVAGVSLLIWWSSSHTIQSSIGGLSEFGTWILIFLIFGLLLRMKSDTTLVFISFATAAVIWIRPNQGLGMIALLALAAVTRLRQGARPFAVLRSAGLPFGSLLALIPLHNVVYGGTFAFLPGGHLNATQTSWVSIFRVFRDQQAREFYSGQLRCILYLPSFMPEIYSARLALSLLGFSVAGVLILFVVVRHESRQVWLLIMLSAAVGGQLLPFLKFSLLRYFPIHNIAIYLTAILSLSYYLAMVDSGRQEISSQSQIVGNPTTL